MYLGSGVINRGDIVIVNLYPKKGEIREENVNCFTFLGLEPEVMYEVPPTESRTKTITAYRF